MTNKDDQQTHRQGCRQHQAERAPQRRPERRGDDQRDRRQPGAGAVEPGFHEVVADQFQHHDQGQRPTDHRPAGVDRECQQQREHRTHQRPDIRDETQHRRQQAPQQRARDADQPQPGGHRHRVQEVDDQLHRQIAADALASVVERVGGTEHAVAQQSDQAIAQVVRVQQHQDQIDQGRRKNRSRRADPLQPAGHALVGPGRCRDHFHPRRPPGRCGRGPALELALRLGDLGLDGVDDPAGLGEDTGCAQLNPQPVELFRDVVLISRQLLAKQANLAGHEHA